MTQSEVGDAAGAAAAGKSCVVRCGSVIACSPQMRTCHQPLDAGVQLAASSCAMSRGLQRDTSSPPQPLKCMLRRWSQANQLPIRMALRAFTSLRSCCPVAVAAAAGPGDQRGATALVGSDELTGAPRQGAMAGCMGAGRGPDPVPASPSLRRRLERKARCGLAQHGRCRCDGPGGLQFTSDGGNEPRYVRCRRGVHGFGDDQCGDG